MTMPKVVVRPEYLGTAIGFAYIFVKLQALLGLKSLHPYRPAPR